MRTFYVKKSLRLNTVLKVIFGKVNSKKATPGFAKGLSRMLSSSMIRLDG